MSTTFPDRVDLAVYANDAFEVAFQFVEEDETTPIDITGTTFAAQIREKPGHASIAATFSVAQTDDEGTVTLTLTSAQTDGLSTTRRYAWDLVDTTGEETYIYGTVRVTKDVTRT